MLDPATIIDFIFSALAQLSAQYPEVACLTVLAKVFWALCGLCAIATIWMPVPRETTGPMPPCTGGFMASHCTSARTGGRGGRQVRSREGRGQGRDGEMMCKSSLSFFYRWRYGERREADRSAVRDDPSGRWLQSMGGTDRRDEPGPPDAGSHSISTAGTALLNPASGSICPRARLETFSCGSGVLRRTRNDRD